MSSQLTRISVLLLLFYMGWFMWEQNKVVKKQKQQIETMSKQLFYDALIINTYQNYNNQYNQYDYPLEDKNLKTQKIL